MSDDTGVSPDAFQDAVEAEGRPVLTAAQVARHLDRAESAVAPGLQRLVDAGTLGRLETVEPPVYYPIEWETLADRERIVVFPDRRQIVVDRPTQYTRAQLSGFAHLVDTTGTAPGTRGYLYEIGPEDVWNAPFDELGTLLARIRSTLPRRVESLEAWVESQWTRAASFTLRTHEDGYVVLVAESADLMGNVARQKLADDQLRAPISDTESWVNADAIGAVKRTLYEAGYPVRDERDLETGDALDVTLTTDLRAYQQSWVDGFLEKRAGVFVGPPGSGKTVAAIGALAAIGGETLILVPSRELADQWRRELFAHTNLPDDRVGEYHGGTKDVRPVTIATYQTAGMDRHRSLFDSRAWGLIVFDECLSGDTVVETPRGRTTFAALDRRHGFADGWTRDVDLSVRTYDPAAGTDLFADVTGVFRADRPVVEIRTANGRTLTATPDHTHLVFDPDTGRVREQQGVVAGQFLVRPRSPGDAAGPDVDPGPGCPLPVGPLLERIRTAVGVSTPALADMLGLPEATVVSALQGRTRIGQGRLRDLATGLRAIAGPGAAGMQTAPRRAGSAVGGVRGRSRRRTTEDPDDTLTRPAGKAGPDPSPALAYASRLELLEGLAVVEVEDVTPAGVERVYDFETASHTFVADGFLTHNCHHIPSPVFRRSADLQSKHRLGLSATPVRESDDETEIFTLIGPPIGTDWDALFDAGFVQEPEVEIRYVPWGDETARNEWDSAEGREKRGLAARNPGKVAEVRRLREAHADESVLIFVDYLDQGDRIEAELGIPFISGETPHAERQRLFEEFRAGERRTLVVSRVGDEGIDLPNAEVAIVASGLGGSRRQGAQRAGRTMRPSGSARMYVLATRGTREEEFARRRTRHLAEKGVRVYERTVEAVPESVD